MNPLDKARRMRTAILEAESVVEQRPATSAPVRSGHSIAIFDATNGKRWKSDAVEAEDGEDGKVYTASLVATDGTADITKIVQFKFVNDPGKYCLLKTGQYVFLWLLPSWEINAADWIDDKEHLFYSAFRRWASLPTTAMVS